MSKAKTTIENNMIRTESQEMNHKEPHIQESELQEPISLSHHEIMEKFIQDIVNIKTLKYVCNKCGAFNPKSNYRCGMCNSAGIIKLNKKKRQELLEKRLIREMI